MKKLLLGFWLFIVATSSVFAVQSRIHFPRQCVIERSAQSDHFILFWGPEVTDPLNHPNTDLRFDPQRILRDAERYYDIFVNQIRFVDPANYNDFKLIIIMNETWGPSIYTGWAFGGADGGVGAIYVHPRAAAGQTLAHELVHALQTYTGGFRHDSWVGFFWETHANFLAMEPYPAIMPDMARWLNTSHYHWSSTRHHYVNWQFLQFIKDTDGMEIINRMWREQRRGEHPLQAYMRIAGINQEQLNDRFGEHAFRNVKWDYSNRQQILNEIGRIRDRYIHRATIVPEAVGVRMRDWGDFKIQANLAPQDYGYNIIRLFPQTHFENNRRFASVRFRGHMETAPNPGWRYGFVASDAQGQTRFSPIYSAPQGEILFEMQPNETELYLVVVATPTVHRNYNWEPGFPRIFRYPYQFRVVGSVPDGFQEGFRAPPATGGRRHTNGGGWIATTATVAATAFVGPNAQVLNSARVEGNARIEGHAIIRNSARVYGNAIVRDMALIGDNVQVYGSAIVERQARVFGRSVIYDNARITDNAALFDVTVFGNAVIRENAMPWGGSVSGTAIVGGDNEHHMDNLTSGTFLQLAGSGGTDRNVYVNAPFTDFTAREMRHSRSISYNVAPFSTGENIDAVKYDFGGDSVGHFAVSVQGRGSADIRDFPGITAHSAGGGYFISGLRSGDWLNYTVSTTGAGNHLAVLRINSATDRGDVVVTTSQGVFRRTLKNTLGSWDTLAVMINLAAGENVLRVGFESPSQDPLLSFDFFSIGEPTTSVTWLTPFLSEGYSLTVAPTPSISVDATNVMYAALSNNTYIELYSSSQVLLAREPLMSNSGSIKLESLTNGESLSKGIYFIVLRDDSQIKAVERVILLN